MDEPLIDRFVARFETEREAKTVYTGVDTLVWAWRSLTHRATAITIRKASDLGEGEPTQGP